MKPDPDISQAAFHRAIRHREKCPCEICKNLLAELEKEYAVRFPAKKNNYSTFIYRPDKYPGQEVLDGVPSKECDEYHKNAVIQVHLPEEK